MLETSGVGSLFTLCELQRQFAVPKDNKDTKIVFIHLGVASKITKFHLETTAWNGIIRIMLDNDSI